MPERKYPQSPNNPIVLYRKGSSPEIVNLDSHEPLLAPIVSSYNHRIRPVLDAIDRLRSLDVSKEGIQLPTIVVVGDQSSGKSSVLESLARISLPRGQNICTRVPLIMRLKNSSNPHPELSLEYQGKVISTHEDKVAEAINTATEEIAGDGKGISKTPLTLTVKKESVPDLTMVDLPGIVRVPVGDQPKDIGDQIKNIIMEYITPEESIILNVLPATIDFPTCESIGMSQSVDKSGGRTLAVVTKADKAPEGLLEKVTANDVNIGLGYVCVRNRIGDESYDEARQEEATLFETHPLLSKIDKSIVGVPVLAQKLVQIQAKSIEKNLPELVKTINDKLNQNLLEFDKLPKVISSPAEGMATFMTIIGEVKESLRKILLRGEFDEYPDDENLHCTARFVERLGDYSRQLHDCPYSDPKRNFLMDEIKLLKESKQISLPNFLPHTVFLAILKEKVMRVSSIPIDFVANLWDYVEEVVIIVLMRYVEDYHWLQLSTTEAVLNVIKEMKDRSMKWVKEVIEMEKHTDYTCHPEYESNWQRLMTEKDTFINRVESGYWSSVNLELEEFGTLAVCNLRNYPELLHQAYDLRMRMVAYWKIVLRRMVDGMALHLQLSIHELVNTNLREAFVAELMDSTNGGIERLMEESPLVARKREKLQESIKKLGECKEVLAKIMGRVAIEKMF
ncbi:hypothetical protein UlMin_018745 [Ulmus minor]